MPLLLDRRTFLGAAAGLVASARFAMGAKQSLRWALLSDTHTPEDVNDTFRGFQPAAGLKTAVAQVGAAKHLDGILVNGDLARLEGHKGDYARFAELTAPLTGKAPMALLLGNHDDRANAEAAFPSPAGEREQITDKWVSVIEAGPFRVILLDSLLRTNFTPGLLGKQQRTWLDTYLRAHTDRPVLVFVHHTLDDEDGALLDADRFLDIVAPQRHVKAVFYGHSHVYKYSITEGLFLINLPAVGYNFEDSQPVGWIEAELTATNAALTLHAFGGNRAHDGETHNVPWR